MCTSQGIPILDYRQGSTLQACPKYRVVDRSDPKIAADRQPGASLALAR